MKLNAVWALLRQRKRINITGESTQWVGDGNAAYPIYDLPELKEDTLRALLDVDKSKWGQFIVKQVDTTFSEEDNDPYEVPLTDFGITISHAGRELIPLVSAHKIYYIPAKYLKPFGGVDDVLLYVRRFDSGGEYIAIKEGLLLRGIVLPCIIDNKDFVDSLGKVYGLTVNALNELEIARQAAADAEEFRNLTLEEQEEQA